MNKLRIALLQLNSEESHLDNLKKGLRFCEQAKLMGAELALFPELWQIGYKSSLMHMKHALDHDSDFLMSYRRKARELGMSIAITYLGKGNSKPTNNVAVIDKKGDVVLDYAKVHICDFKDGVETTLEAGSQFKTVSLMTNSGAVNLGVMTCFDREFPESARTLMRKGAEIILTPNSCDLQKDKILGDLRLAQFRARAFENMVGVAMANYPAPQHDGHSCAYNVDGQRLVMANKDEQIALADFNLTYIRNWRRKEVWADRSSQPRAYTYASKTTARHMISFFSRPQNRSFAVGMLGGAVIAALMCISTFEASNKKLSSGTSTEQNLGVVTHARKPFFSTVNKNMSAKETDETDSNDRTEKLSK